MGILNSKRQFIISLGTLVALVVVSVRFLSPGTPSHAASTKLSLDPASASVQVGQNINVNVRISSGSDSINTGVVHITYPQNLFDAVVNPAQNSDAFNLNVKNTASNGLIDIERGAYHVVTDPNTQQESNQSFKGDGVYAVITLHAKATGTAALTIQNDAELYGESMVNGVPANMFSSATGSTITITAASSGTTTTPTTPTNQTSTTTSKTTTTSTSTSKTTTPAPITTSATQTAPGAPKVTNLQVTGVEDRKPVVTWTTDQTSTSAVEYGLNSAYGAAAASIEKTTSHSVEIDPKGLLAGYTYYVKATSANDKLEMGSDTTSFKMPGLSVTIKVTGLLGAPLPYATVTLDGQTKTTDLNGVVTFEDVKPGSQRVAVKSGTSTVTSNVNVDGTKTDNKQQFLVAADKGLSLVSLGAGLLVLLIVAGGGLVYWKRKAIFNHPDDNDSTGSGFGGGFKPSPSITPSTAAKSAPSGDPSVNTVTMDSVIAKPSSEDILSSLGDEPAAPVPGSVIHPSAPQE